MSDNEVFGARAYKMDSNIILIKQTVKKGIGSSERYVVDTLADGTHREQHLDINDDNGIANAIRSALIGKL